MNFFERVGPGKCTREIDRRAWRIFTDCQSSPSRTLDVAPDDTRDHAGVSLLINGERYWLPSQFEKSAAMFI